jgi:ribulose bisphosphate carboxylase small subunit
LAYKSERETYHDQQFRKVNAIRHRLGWKPGIAYPDGPKPKGMHWKTFTRMKAKHDFHVRCILGYQQEWIAKIQSGMGISL